MEFIKVKSSNVEGIAYDGGNLYVKYPSGIYEYRGVPKEAYEALMAAESKGRFLTENVKGKYQYKKLFE